MQNRAELIDKNFIGNVKQQRLPASITNISLAEANLSDENLQELFLSQLTSRHIDLQARILKEQNQGYYTIASCGHEGNAAVAAAFRHTDLAFLHYRSAAFMTQRAKQLPGTNNIRDQLLSLVASKDEPCSGGRHKVFGSKELTVPPQTSTIASHLPKAVGAALSITLSKELNHLSKLPHDSVVLCSFGDASVNHSTALGAFNAASWMRSQGYPLPIVFVCEDNGLGISVKTPTNWIENNFSNKPGLTYIQADGLHLIDVYAKAIQAERLTRTQHQPVFLHVKMNRLLGHAGSDIETQYRTQAEIDDAEFNDPLLHSARIILENNSMSADEIIDAYEQARVEVAAIAEEVIKAPKLQTAVEVMAPIIPPKAPKHKVHAVIEEQRESVYGDVYPQLSLPRNLCQHINFALTDLMLQYPQIISFGEDVGKKGGVYRVTADLQQRFGARRVFDTLLDEQTILGTAIGLAHNGFIPIPEIQFLAYLHNAEDQLRGEAATLSFFSQGQFTNPMVLRIPSFAYQKGFGGHFHNDNSIAVLRDIPGIIVACPSNGHDAACMLREAVRLADEEQRVVIFLEPIALYMTKDLHAPGDGVWLSQYPRVTQRINLGEIGVKGEGGDLAIISFANGYYYSVQAAKVLQEQHNRKVKLIDLRWLAPLNEKAIIDATKDCKQVLIVDEERQTGSISEGLMTLLYNQPVKMKRITGKDSFIPLGDAWKTVLPGRDEIVTAALAFGED